VVITLCLWLPAALAGESGIAMVVFV